MQVSLERIAQFIRQHAFPAIVRDGKVHFPVPCTYKGEPAGVVWFQVKTLAEARRALGY